MRIEKYNYDGEEYRNFGLEQEDIDELNDIMPETVCFIFKFRYEGSHDVEIYLKNSEGLIDPNSTVCIDKPHKRMAEKYFDTKYNTGVPWNHDGRFSISDRYKKKK